MNIETNTALGEIRFEFKDDGSGLLHVIRTDKTFVRDADTGKLLLAPKLEAVALEPGDLAALVGEQFAGVAEQVTALTAELAAANAAKAAAETAKVEAANAQPAVPTVTRLQARLALAQAGLLVAVEALISSMPVDALGRVYWDNSATWVRDNAVLNELAADMGLTGEQLDALFVSAATFT